MVEELLVRLVNAAVAEQQRENARGSCNSTTVAGLEAVGAQSRGGVADDQSNTPWQPPATSAAAETIPAEPQDKGDELLAADEDLNLTSAAQQVSRSKVKTVSEDSGVIRSSSISFRLVCLCSFSRSGCVTHGAHLLKE